MPISSNSSRCRRHCPGAPYANAKLHLGKDINAIRRMKRGERDYAKSFEREPHISLLPLPQVRSRLSQPANSLVSRQMLHLHRSPRRGSSVRTMATRAGASRPGELVAMYLINSPEFLLIWMAMMAIGCAPAFINYNLEGNALIHCLKVCETKIILCDDDAACRKRIEGK